MLIPTIVLTLIGNAALFWLTTETIAGARPTAMEGVRAGLPRAAPLFLLMLLQGLAFAVGFVLFIVPGVMMLVAWIVSGPLLVCERVKIMDSFKLSAQLTKGNRWRIFGLVLLAGFAIIIAAGAIGSLGGFAALGGESPVGAIVLQPLANVVTYLMSYVGAAVLYTELKAIKQGVGAESLAKVFD